jgi:hypothetical protein
VAPSRGFLHFGNAVSAHPEAPGGAGPRRMAANAERGAIPGSSPGQALRDARSRKRFGGLLGMTSARGRTRVPQEFLNNPRILLVALTARRHRHQGPVLLCGLGRSLSPRPARGLPALLPSPPARPAPLFAEHAATASSSNKACRMKNRRTRNTQRKRRNRPLEIGVPDEDERDIVIGPPDERAQTPAREP